MFVTHMKISTESKMDFDYSVGTEDRFALRKWFQGLIDNQNYRDLKSLVEFYSPEMVVEGFTDEPMNFLQFVQFLKQHHETKKMTTVRYPEIKVKFSRYLFHLVGNYEEFIDGVLSYEGPIELKIKRENEQFRVALIKFYPRLRVAD